MTGGCTGPIYYQGVVSVEKGSVMILYQLAELIKKDSEPANPLSRSHVSSMTRAGSRTLPSRRHIPSMTGERTYPIYYQTVVSVDKGSMIIRYQKTTELSRDDTTPHSSFNVHRQQKKPHTPPSKPPRNVARHGND